MDAENEGQLSDLLHDLRTPLNQIVGLSEMLLEIAEEENHRDLFEGLATVRDAGVELATLLQDNSLLTLDAQSGAEFWPLTDAVRAPVSRVLGFVDLVLDEPSAVKLGAYLDDLALIRTAGRHFLELARASSLFIRLETASHWDARSPVQRQPPRTSVPANGRVLIVDDESLNREVLCRRLQREGYRPTGVRSGRDALQLLRNVSFDIILLDIQMPEMSGIEVLQALKQNPAWSHLPVIMLSALTDVERIARCIELGAEDYLPKPINAVLLRARLSACLGKKQLHDQGSAHLDVLHAEKERLSVTLRSLADAVIMTDEFGRVVLFNEVAERLTGVANAAAQGRPFAEVFPLVHRATGLPAVSVADEALARSEVFESEKHYALKFADGRVRLVAARSAPFADHAGTTIGTVVVVRDVTESEKMAEELLRSSKLQSIGVLAGGMAHDFNNMLTAIVGNLSFLREQPGFAPEVMLSLQEAERGALRAQELTRYLLTFAEGGAPIKQVADARALLQKSSAFVLRGSSTEADFRLSADLWEIEVDPGQIAQAISSIVLNAVEASADGGQIVIEAENVSGAPKDAALLPEGDYLRIVVRDFGVGIAREHLPRIYDPFFTTKKQSRGLGLAAAYSIIQRHHGHIEIFSVEGKGTAVTIYLPAHHPVEPPLPVIAVAPQAVTPVPVIPRRSDGGDRPRVLVMDDDVSIRTILQTMLRSMNYEAVLTDDGEAALAAHATAKASARPFDFVIMDLTIPGGMGGKETMHRMRATDAEIYAIVSSGYSNDPVMSEFASHGFNAVLPKPYGVQNLRDVLQAVPAAV
jgi:PAS domain S-box-containing protein